MNLLRMNIWRKLILGTYIAGVVIMFAFDWGYHYHIGHVIRMGVGAAALWLVVDKM